MWPSFFLGRNQYCDKTNDQNSSYFNVFKSISDRYRSDRNPVGPTTVQYRLKQNASWEVLMLEKRIDDNIHITVTTER